MSQVVFIDVETGGTDARQHSIMEIGVLGREWVFEAYVREERVQCTPEAREIHKISPQVLERKGSSPREVVAELELSFGDDLITMAGWNVKLDYDFTRRLYEQAGRAQRFRERFDYRLLDVQSVFAFAKEVRLVETERSSLDGACEEFAIEQQTAHRALADAKAARDVYDKLVERFRSRGP